MDRGTGARTCAGETRGIRVVIFDRAEELESLRSRLEKRRAFLLHGPAGVGKSLLLRQAAGGVPSVLCCQDSRSPLLVFRSLAGALIKAGSEYVRSRLGPSPEKATAVSTKGVVVEALRRGRYTVVLDRLPFTSQSFAAALREIIGWAATPVVCVARSHHMEDVGFVLNLYPGRADCFELCNFAPETALEFAQRTVAESGLTAGNLPEFLDRVVDLSGGNPGAILSMVKMAMQPKYRSEEHIKITPLYVDFRMSAICSSPSKA